MNSRILTTIYFGLFLLIRESHFQVIFPNAGFTIQPSFNVTGANPFLLGNNQNSFGNTNNFGFPNRPFGNYNPYNSNNNPYGNNNNYYSTISPFIQTNVCICVPFASCFIASGNNPSGVIDIRIVNTPTGIATGSITPITNSVSSGISLIVASQSFCQSNLDLCCPVSGFTCGIRYSPFSNALTPSGSQAQYGSYPWQGLILTSNNLYVGSGVLIDHKHFLTVAHKVNAFLNNGVQLKVRLGEWDVAVTTEPFAYQEFTVSRIFIHPQYSSITLANSIAILRLNPTVPLGQIPTITTGCLPSSSVNNIRCWVAGWGSRSFLEGSTSTTQMHVDVPIVDVTNCQLKLRSTRLGSNFNLDTFSFICAGGEAGKDACTGDGGAPLVCPIGGRWFVVGLVAWGIGCGTSDIPGVYINVANYINWIQSTTSTP